MEATRDRTLNASQESQGLRFVQGRICPFHYQTDIDAVSVVDYFYKFTGDKKCAKPGHIIFQQSIASFMAKLRLTL